MKKWLLLLFLASGIISAQTTTYAGTTKDLTGTVVTSRRVIFTSMSGVDTTISGTARFTPSRVACNINSAGDLESTSGGACVVTNNTSLTPSGTYYKVNMLPYYATPGSVFNVYALGGTVNLANVVTIPATAPAYGYVPNQVWGTNPFLDFGVVQGLSAAGITSPSAGIFDFGNEASGDTSGPTYAAFINGIPQADQFPGADFCVKLRAANLYAVANNIGTVDATHFTGIQACSVDPFNTLTTALANVRLIVQLPAAWIKTTVPWVINNSGLNIFGQGVGQTWIDYTGAAGASAVISSVGSVSGYIQSNQIERLAILGGNGNVTDGLYFTYSHHWKVEDVDTWGMTGCGIHTAFAVTPTMIRPRTSTNDADQYGWLAGRSTPASGLCLDEVTVGSVHYQTTDGTIIDAAAEGTTGSGWTLPGTSNLTFTSGTSEDGFQGITIGADSNFNTFVSVDLEGNTANINGVDVIDNGSSDYFINIIAISPCTSCTSMTMNKFWSFVSGGNILHGVSGAGTNVFKFGNEFQTSVTFARGMSTANIINGAGLQLVKGPGCTITAGAVGNACTAAKIFFSPAQADTKSIPVCSLVGSTGLNVLGAISVIGDTSFIPTEVAMSTTATGGGTIVCIVGHN